MSKRIFPVGIIAEDDSDVSCIKIFIHRIASNDKIGVKKFVGKGCGKITRKSNAWANQLRLKGCRTLILVHDLDNNNLTELIKKIKDSLNPCPIEKHFICIPIQELEAWLLSDPEAIKLSMNLGKVPKISGIPEKINSPKEYLGDIIYKFSNKEKIYMNTKHNEKIASEISFNKVKTKCPSFNLFYEFVNNEISKN